MRPESPRSGLARTTLVSRALAKVLRSIPDSQEPLASDPRSRSQRLATLAARKAGALSASLALPPGPLGFATLLPDLVGIWHLQSRLVSDIAAAHGKTAALTKESMVYCLFKHGSAALLRDLVARAGERYLVRRASVSVMQGILAKVGVRITQQGIGKAVARYVPMLGALGVGAYAYYDTSRVGATAIELFSQDVQPAPGAPS